MNGAMKIIVLFINQSINHKMLYCPIYSSKTDSALQCLYI